MRVPAFLLAGDISSEEWIRPVPEEQLADVYGRALVAPAPPTRSRGQQGRQVCACFNVTEPSILDTLKACPNQSAQSADQQLTHLQGTLKCGTNCGSCVPELRKIIKLHLAETTPA